MILKVLTSESEVAAIADRWWNLFDSVPASSPYCSPSWTMAWWKAREYELRSWHCIVACDASGDLLGVLPLVLCPDGILRYAGHDMHDIAEALGEREVAGQLWMRAAVDAATGGGMEITTIAARDLVLVEHCVGKSLKVRGVDPGARIFIDGTWADYLGRLSRPVQKKIQYEERILARDCGLVEFQTKPSKDGLAADVDALWELREMSWKGRGRYQELADEARGRRLRAFLRALASQSVSSSSPIEVGKLSISGRVIASAVLLRSDQRMWYPLCAFDPSMGKYGPGRRLVIECVKYAIAREMRTFEMGRGIEKYKLDLGAEQYTLSDVGMEP